MRKKARKTPASSSSQPVSFRLPDGLRDKVRDAARRDRRTMTQWMVIVLEKALAEQSGH